MALLLEDNTAGHEKYMVVEFPNEKENDTVPMAVVSSKWLQQNEDDNDVYCLWPTYFKSDAARIRAVEQHHELNMKQCIQNLVNVKYSTGFYQKAVQKMKALEKCNSVSESDDSEEFRKRKRKTTKQFEDFVGQCSSDEETIPIVPKLPLRYSKYTTESSSQKENGFSTSTLRNLPEESQCSTPVSSSFTRSLNPPLRSRSSTPALSSTLNQDAYTCKCNENKALIREVLQIVKNIKRDLKEITTSNVSNDTNLMEVTESQQKKTVEELNVYNNVLESPQDMQNSILLLQTLGGRDVMDSTRRILQTIVSNDLACRFNWTGKNGKGCFSHLKNVINLVTVVVRRNKCCSNTTQQEVEAAIKAWLRNAPDRDGGRSKRQKL